VLVFFAPDVQLHQMPGKPFTGALRLGSVCKSTVQAQRAINGEDVHGINSQDHFGLSIGKVRCFVLFRKNRPSHGAILGAKMMAPREIIKLTTTLRDRAPDAQTPPGGNDPLTASH
jgi:hypothetical protein